MKFISRVEQGIPLVRSDYSWNILFNIGNELPIFSQLCNIFYLIILQ